MTKSLPHRLLLALPLLLLLASAPVSARVPAARLDPAIQVASVQNLPADLRAAATLAPGRLGVLDTRSTEAPAWAVRFHLDRPQRLRLEILDLRGHVVRTLAQGLWAPGEHVQAWYGQDDSEEPLPPGRYLVRLRTLPTAAQVVRR